MTAKEYLNQYRGAVRRTQALTDHLAELKAQAYSLKDHEGHSIALDAAVARYVDACDRAGAELVRLSALRAEIAGVIAQVQDPLLHDLLWDTYICGRTLEQFAVKSHYHYVSVCRFHGRALQIVTGLMPKSCY